MLLFSLSFLLGDLCLQLLPTLPNAITIVTVLVTGFLFCYICKQTLPIGLALGFAYSACFAGYLLSWTLPFEWEQKPILINGTIVSLPTENTFGTHLLFELEDTHAYMSLNTSLPLSAFHPGDQWRFLVKLKRIHGLKSPGAFDYEAWALENHIRSAGKIINSPANLLLSSHWYSYPLQRLRENLRNKITAATSNPFLLAIMLGERHGFSQKNWSILRASGTNHLMAIAGLHIGIVAFLMHLIVMRCWRLVPTIIIPAKQASSLAALVSAFFYSCLAGFSIPTERAFIMLVLFTFIVLHRRSANLWNIWSLTLFLLLLINPISVLSESFWLSMGTIALIIYGMQGRLEPRGIWWRWGRVQFVIALGLVPLSLLFFQEISFISFIANCVAIPYLTLILSLCLLSLPFLYIYSVVSYFLLSIADHLMQGLWWFLVFMAEWPRATFSMFLPQVYLFVFIFFGTLLILAPRGFPGKSLALVWFLPLFTYRYPMQAYGDMKLTVLDVGQGLATTVQTQNHLLVYDAGPALGEQSAGERIVIPYLHTIGKNRIDMLVISHGDNDHLGGAKAILAATTVLSVKTSVPSKIPTPVTTYCRAGTKWQWDGVDFEFLYPAQHRHVSKNDDSCVLRVSHGATQILLPGDIEKYAEKMLIKNNYAALKTTFLISPHHGSKTSANPAFVAATHPQWLIYSTGYLNRYHFPHPSVVAAFAALQTKQLNTADSGTITITINNNRKPIIDLYRQSHAHYWYHS